MRLPQSDLRITEAGPKMRMKMIFSRRSLILNHVVPDVVLDSSCQEVAASRVERFDSDEG